MESVEKSSPSSPPPSSSKRRWQGSPTERGGMTEYPAHSIMEHQLAVLPWGELARPYPLVHVDAMPSISEDEFDCDGDNDDKDNCCCTIDPDFLPKERNGGFSHPWNDITPDALLLSRPYRFHHVDAMVPTIVEGTTESDETDVIQQSFIG